MPSFLRTIVKKRWDTNPDVPWLEPNELKADVLRDLPTSDGVLSIWEINEEISPERISIALAATRKSLDVFDYVVFDGSELSPPSFNIERTTGETPDEAINGLHFDLQYLTTLKLTSLADIVSKGDKCRILRKQVRKSLLEGLDSGRLSAQAFNQELLEKLGRVRCQA